MSDYGIKVRDGGSSMWMLIPTKMAESVSDRYVPESGCQTHELDIMAQRMSWSKDIMPSYSDTL